VVVDDYRRIMKHDRLWATTTTSANIVQIFVHDCAGYQAYCQYTPRHGTSVYVSQAVLDTTDPFYLQETLVHEFVHVLEEHFKRELKLPNPPDCTQYAIIIGRELPRMLRNLKRV
jgi:hypothetical protein